MSPSFITRFIAGLLHFTIACGFIHQVPSNIRQWNRIPSCRFATVIDGDLIVSQADNLPDSADAPVADFFAYDTKPSAFEDMQQWQDLQDFLHEFGSIYANDKEVINGIFKSRRHYPYKLSLCMDRIATLYSDDGELKNIGLQTRLFVESAVSLFAPDGGWESNTRMVGQQISFLRNKYQHSENFMSFLVWCEQINEISKGDLHVHIDGGVSRENKVCVADIVFKIANYARVNLEKYYEKDSERALQGLKAKIDSVSEVFQNIESTWSSQVIDSSDSNEENSEHNWASQIRLRAKEQIVFQEKEHNRQVQSQINVFEKEEETMIADVQREAKAKIAKIRKETEAKIIAVKETSPLELKIRNERILKDAEDEIIAIAAAANEEKKASGRLAVPEFFAGSLDVAGLTYFSGQKSEKKSRKEIKQEKAKAHQKSKQMKGNRKLKVTSLRDEQQQRIDPWEEMRRIDELYEYYNGKSTDKILARATMLEQEKGTDDVEAMIAKCDLADAYILVNELVKAKELLVPALEWFTKNFGTENLYVFRCSLSLSSVVLRVDGDFVGAKVLAESAAQLLPMFEHAGDKQAIASAFGNMGALWKDLGELDAALPLLRRAFKEHEALRGSIRENIHGRVVSGGNLGLCLILMDKADEATELLTPLVQLASKHMPMDQSCSVLVAETLQCAQMQLQFKRGVELVSEKNEKEALPYFQRAFTDLKRVFSSHFSESSSTNYPAVLGSMSKIDAASRLAVIGECIAHCLLATGNTTGAIAFLEPLLAETEAILGEHDENVIQLFLTLAVTYISIGDRQSCQMLTRRYSSMRFTEVLAYAVKKLDGKKHVPLAALSLLLSGLNYLQDAASRLSSVFHKRK